MRDARRSYLICIGPVWVRRYCQNADFGHARCVRKPRKDQARFIGQKAFKPLGDQGPRHRKRCAIEIGHDTISTGKILVACIR